MSCKKGNGVVTCVTLCIKVYTNFCMTAGVGGQNKKPSNLDEVINGGLLTSKNLKFNWLK